MKVKTGMGDEARKKIAKTLEHFLADTYALYLKTQNFHWNLKGPNFIALHLLFEKQYSEMAEAIDEIAERIQALGFHVEAAFSTFAKNSCIEEEKKPLKEKQMIEGLLEGHETVVRCAREISKTAESANDGATVDLLARRLGVHEKAAWMLRSHL